MGDAVDLFSKDKIGRFVPQHDKWTHGEFGLLAHPLLWIGKIPLRPSIDVLRPR